MKPNQPTPQKDEAEDPAGTPVYWIGKWVDYSDKYGLGYQLSDNSVGVLFNDNSKLLLDGGGEQVQYIERNNVESYYTITVYPETLNKKITLLKYFRNYMNDHLLKAGAHMAPKEGDELARLPFLRTWFRTRTAIILHLTNGTLQVNFFSDHTKLILCPLMKTVTFIDEKKHFKTFKFELIEKFGCTKELFSRIRYVKTMVERMLTQSSSSRPGALSTGVKGSGATSGSSGMQQMTLGSQPTMPALALP